jgi:hypothetical protein
MDPNRPDLYLLWKGHQSGPFSLAFIRERLTSGEINRMHQVSVDGRWLLLGDFLDQQDGGAAEFRRRAEAAQREQIVRRQYEAQLAAERARRSLPPESAPPSSLSHLLPAAAPSDLPPPPPASFRPAQGLPISLPPVGQPLALSGSVTTLEPPVDAPRTSGLAIAAFVLSLCNLIPYLNFLTWILALIFGHMALVQTEHDPQLGGRRLAVAALIITYSLLALVLLVVLVLMMIYGPRFGHDVHV